MITEVKHQALPKIVDERGNLSFIESGQHVPFSIRRAYWIYDVPGGEMRGSHAFRRQEEFIVALSGSFDVVLEDKNGQTQRIHLSRSYNGVYVPPMTWRTLDNFSTNSLGLVLSSTHYDPDDYIWDKQTLHNLPEKVLATTDLPLSFSTDKTTPQLRYNLEDCRCISLPSHTELRRGYLTAIEEESETLPFSIQRIFYIYDIPSGAVRGAHAHYKAWQFIVAASSCFDVVLDDGNQRRTFRLDRPYQGLLVPPGIWCHLHNFSSAAVALVLTSEPYDIADYMCDYNEYLNYRKP